VQTPRALTLAVATVLGEMGPSDAALVAVPAFERAQTAQVCSEPLSHSLDMVLLAPSAPGNLQACLHTSRAQDMERLQFPPLLTKRRKPYTSARLLR